MLSDSKVDAKLATYPKSHPDRWSILQNGGENPAPPNLPPTLLTHPNPPSTSGVMQALGAAADSVSLPLSVGWQADTAMNDEEITSALGDDILRATAEEINSRCRLLDNEIKAMKNDSSRLTHEQANVKDRIKENDEKIKLNKQLPYLVGNIVEVAQPPLSFAFPSTCPPRFHPVQLVGSHTGAPPASSSEAVRDLARCTKLNRGSC